MTIKRLDHVEPGNLITAPLFNTLLDNIADLQAQIDGLGSSSVEITSVSPAGDVIESSTLTIEGRNFLVPAVLNKVAFDSTPVELFFSGTNSQLVIGVPGNMPSVPGDKTLTVNVPGRGSDFRPVHVIRPPVQLTGKAVIADKSGSLGTIIANTPYTFQFELDGVNLNMAEQFQIKAVFTNAAGVPTTDWDANTSYIGTTGSDHQVAVGANAKTIVGVVVRIPTNAQRADMNIQVNSVHNHPTSSTSLGPIPIIVGAIQAPSSGAVVFTFGQQTSPNVTTVGVGNVLGLQVKFGANPIVNMNGTYTVAGTYTYSALQIEADAGGSAGGWSAGSFVPSSQAHAAGDSEVLQFKIQAPASAPADGVQRYLRITATRQESSAPGQLQSYYRFPIVGVA